MAYAFSQQPLCQLYPSPTAFHSMPFHRTTGTTISGAMPGSWNVPKANSAEPLPSSKTCMAWTAGRNENTFTIDQEPACQRYRLSKATQRQGPLPSSKLVMARISEYGAGTGAH